MQIWQVIGLLILGFGLLSGAILIRAKYGEQFQLSATDLILIILPLAFMLLATGKIKDLNIFGVQLNSIDLFAKAAEVDIEAQVTDTGSPGVDEFVNMLEMSAKGGVQEIPNLIANKTEALMFRLGHGGYYGPAIQQYFDALYASSYFQYLVIINEDGTLFGIYDALDIAVHFRTEDAYIRYDEFAAWLNSGETMDQEALVTLPGFIGRNQAVNRDITKRDALARMDNLRVDSLPVADGNDMFVGTIERSQLTASLILDVLNRLEKEPAAAAE